MKDEKRALVLGVTGGAGYEIARALIQRGWQVRAMARSPVPARLPQAEWVAGDALNAADVAAAAIGADVIVHGVNPPGYKDWAKLVLPMLENTVAAARISGARIFLPGTIYNYGRDALPLLTEDAPQRPHTRKGRIRVQMEQRLEAAAQEGVRTLILRAGDFFGPSAGNSWFSQGMVTPGRPVTKITYPGKRDAGHAWAYLPDYGATAAALLDRETELAAFEQFHFRGHYFARGVAFAEAVRAASGGKGKIAPMPWPALVLLSPFVRIFRELAEMRYLWEETAELDNTRLVSFLGHEPHTDIMDALSWTLAAMGCFPEAADHAPGARPWPA
ncbi:NAD-dependent epimerase/dehydratase family protein [Hyphomonas sp. NPDC076900]|uniref:NAD-dependent epimerase/dehydratase family protein n=1 Tax=unclassified Hyphomonas TaxID=2630699 RepID=UPI003CFD7872